MPAADAARFTEEVTAVTVKILSDNPQIKSDYEAARRELALTASLLYDQYFVAARSLEINAQHIELMRAVRSGATAQYESGRGSAQDALQAELELAHMEHDAAVLASQRRLTAARLNELLHRPPEAPLPPPPATLQRRGEQAQPPGQLHKKITLGGCQLHGVG